LDAHFTYKLWEIQSSKLDKTPNLRKGYQLLHDTSLTFADLTWQGISIDEKQLDENIIQFLSNFGKSAVDFNKAALLKIENQDFSIVGIKRLKEVNGQAWQNRLSL
jgi:hypothetical protein